MKVITAALNNPILIEVQYYTLKKYMKCNYEFIVFNDAKYWPEFTNYGTEDMMDKIEETCKKLKIKCIELPNKKKQKSYSQADQRTADYMTFITKYILANPDKYLYIEPDMFLLDDFKLEDYENYYCATTILNTTNKKISYPNHGIFYIDSSNSEIKSNKNILDWKVDAKYNTNYPGDYDKLNEVGEKCSTWLLSLDTNKVKYMTKLSGNWSKINIPERLLKLETLLSTDPRNKNGLYFAELYDDKFLYFKCSGNFNKIAADQQQKLTMLLINNINILLAS